jgi:hypothetical protein
LFFLSLSLSFSCTHTHTHTQELNETIWGWGRNEVRNSIQPAWPKSKSSLGWEPRVVLACHPCVPEGGRTEDR